MPPPQKHQEVLYQATNGTWLPAKVIEVGHEVHIYLIMKTSCTTFKRNLRILKLVDYTVIPEQPSNAAINCPALQESSTPAFPTIFQPPIKCVHLTTELYLQQPLLLKSQPPIQSHTRKTRGPGMIIPSSFLLPDLWDVVIRQPCMVVHHDQKLAQSIHPPTQTKMLPTALRF